MRKGWMTAMVAGLALAAPGAAQVRTIDPNQAIDADLPARPMAAQTAASRAAAARAAKGQVATRTAPAPAPSYEPVPADVAQDDPVPAPAPTSPARAEAAADRREVRADRTQAADATFRRDDLIGAGEGVFGKGAQGFAGIIERILHDQGEPNAYIAGREASGAFVVGLRYGSGVMTHKVEGQMPVYWTGPSVGFDVGGDANKVFVLVYNLYDTAELYHRFPQAEGHLYAVGGFSASYLRWGHVVVIPVRLGVGWRAGVNVGYMKFTRRSKWLPF